MGSLEGQFDTKLHEAVRYSDLEEVKVALQQSYDPNLIGLYQWSALHEAAHNGEKEILQLLLQKKGDPNKSDYLQARTAMHYASEQGHIDCLQMLIKAGGRYDIKDSDGKTSLDLATPGGRKILEKLRVRDIMLNKPEDTDTVISDEGIASDRSHDQVSLISSRRSSIDSFKDKGPALGYLHLSVEYHSVKSSLKIRIWQLTDLLLPPSNTSMIHSIYVKSYLQPDKKKDSKRKTEEVKVDSSQGHIHWRRKKEVSVQHVFTPATFKFSRPLEYSGITGEHIKEKNLQIEVCITQRYSHRSYLIGMVRMSLKSAIKKLVKENLPLIPCMNHTIPANMKVYSASELTVQNNTPGGNIFFSNPNVRIVLPEDADDASDKAASNPDLQPGNIYSPSMEVDMDAQYKFVPTIPKLDLSNMTLDESGYSSEFHVSIPSELESPDSNSSKSSFSSPVKGIIGGQTSSVGTDLKKVKAVPVLEGIQEHKLPQQENVKQESNIQITDLDDEELETISIEQNVGSDKNKSNLSKKQSLKSSKDKDMLGEVKVESNSQIEKNKEKINKKSKKLEKKSDKKAKADNLDWDYYDIPSEVVTQEVERPVTPWKEGAAPVILPMETMMGLHQTQETKLARSEEREKVARRSKKKFAQPVPGGAVPVPSIVVTSPENRSEKDRKEKKVKVNQDVSVVSDHVSEISVIDSHTGGNIEAKVDIHPAENEVLNSKKGDKKAGLKKIERKAFINVGKAMSGNKENVAKSDIESQSDTQEKTEKDQRIFKLKSRFKNFMRHKDSSSHDQKLKFDRDVSKISESISETGTDFTGVVVDKTKENSKPVSGISDSKSGSSLEETGSQSSVILDMERLGFQSSGAHVVELIEEDISITELGENGELFTDRSEATSLGASMTLSDVESGLGDYKLPECKSPTKYMIPMQVYDVDDTSCDESMSIDCSYIPTTEL